ncbi:MAG: CoA-binding protein [Deltaproteobacteria bacterium]|nr:CoA-binding protein [Deltaproteobacteria bacterium]
MTKIVTGLEPLFNPRSVAVIGASNNVNKWGRSTFSSLMKHYRGDLYAVNKREEKILGHPVYKRVTDIPGEVDLVVIVIPPENVAGVMEDCVKKGIKASVIITAGFAETGPQGKALQDKVVNIARRGGIRIVGPNCMGMWSASARLTAFMFPMDILDGPLALISQGGNIGGALVADATARGIGFRHYVSCGCTADIQIEDYVEYLGHDDSVKVIMLYIEGLGDGNRFVEKVKKVTRMKPVVALKPGKTDAAARAISSHSGALSGSDPVYDAAFKKAGVLRVESSTELLDLGIGLLTQPLPKGRNVVITTPGGSYGVMCAEACALRGMNIIDLPDSAMKTFNTMFPSRWSHGNPVDPAGDRDFVQYLRAPEVALQCPEVDALIFMGFGSFSALSSVFGGGKGGTGIMNWVKGIEGIEEMAPAALKILNSGDEKDIRQLVKALIGMMFASIMPTKSLKMDEFLETLSGALTTEKMLHTSFFDTLNDLFESLTTGNSDKLGDINIMDLMEPIPGALVRGLIEKYGKPMITTTFTEGNTQLSEAGHFPYPNSDRASNVLKNF